MKHCLAAFIMAVTFISCVQDELVQSVPEADKGSSAEVSDVFVSGEAYVYLSNDLTAIVEDTVDSGSPATKSEPLNNVLEDLGISRMYRLFPHAGEFEPRTREDGLHRWYVVEYSPDMPVTKARSSLETVPGIEKFEPARKIRNNDFNDLTSDLWGLYNREKTGVDINVRPVWNNYTAGNPEVIVSVVDSGVDLTHEDLSANVLASGHRNFVDNNSVIKAGSHGTHVAGTIAAVGNNGKGVVGVAGGDYAKGKSGVKILSCQIFKDGTDTQGSSAQAIKWGADHGAVISQNSWGYTYDADGDGKLTGDELERAMDATISGPDKDAIDYFIRRAGCDNLGNQLPDSPMKGGVVIFAAGNETITNAAPAAYESVIAVGSIASNGTRSSFSNYGDWVDICAPGTDIISTLPDNSYGMMSGTSMACPHVSGVAALIVSHFGGPGFTNEMLKEKLLGSANKSVISQAYQIGGLVDAYGAFAYGNDKAPEAVVDLEGTGRGNNLDLAWTVPADEDGKAAYGFMIMYDPDRSKIEAATEKELNEVRYMTVTPNAKAGDKVEFSIPFLEFETTYHIKMAAYSYGRNYSGYTDIVTLNTTGNNPPVIEFTAEEDLTLMPSETINIIIEVTEPDDHKMTVELISGSPAENLTSTPDGKWRLTIKGNAVDMGTYTSTIKATDEYGLSASAEIEYTIRENMAPVKVSDPEDIFMKAKGQEMTMDLSKYFSDPDGEQLKYEVTMSDEKTAHCNVKGNSLIITAIAYGSTDVTVKASDARGESVTVTFILMVKDPSDPLSVYPNPATDFVYVGTLDMADTMVTIVSQTGKTVYEDKVKASAFEPAKIDISAFAPGIYTMRVSFGGGEYKKTIVKI